jgi:hypothetical protein
MRKITREEPPKNPSKKEKPIKEKATIEKEKEKLEDKPLTPEKRNPKHKVNKVIRSNTKDPNTLV